MSTAYFSAIGNHLWQSTLLAGLAWLLTLASRKNRARVRHGIWLAASCKFLFPLSALVALGGQMRWHTAEKSTPSNFAMVVEAGRRLAAPAISPSVPADSSHSSIPAVLVAVWACGFLGIACTWWIRWRRIRRLVRVSSPLRAAIPLRAVSSSVLAEPGVFGLFRPVLILPSGICDSLTPEQLDAVVAHEMCHVRHRDNLTAALHMAVETVFWFYPLVWWMGRRMVEERERACDEEVLRMGHAPRTYADAILRVCKLYVESPLACVAGVAGANLRNRIAAIMKGNASVGLSAAQKAALLLCGTGAVVLPIAIGTLNARAIGAQAAGTASARPEEHFEVASVRPSAPVPPTGGVYFGPPRGGPDTRDPEQITWSYATLKAMIMLAYDVKSYQVSGPNWLASERYDVAAKVPADATKEQVKRMWQNLIADRFGVALHQQPKEFQIYELIIAKGGPKLKRSASDEPDAEGPPKTDKDGNLSGPGMINLITHESNGVSIHSMAKAQPLDRLTVMLGSVLNRPVIDKTGLTGKYDFDLEFAPDPGSFPLASGPGTSNEAGRGPDVISALQRQLGLTVLAGKANLAVLIIDKAERVPTAN